MATKKINQSAVALAQREYARMIDDEYKRDKSGFIMLEHSADMIDSQSEKLTSNIESLEERLRKYREEKSKYMELKKTPEYKEEVSNKKKRKKAKKARQTLLEMVFNNADELRESIRKVSEEEESDEHYSDSTKTKRAAAKAAREAKKSTTLETTYGTRYAPIVTTYYDMMGDYDEIITDIQSELKTKQGQARSVYRSAQTGNLVSAMNAKFSVAKQIESVANKITDLEYKKSKDQKGDESDTTRAISFLGAQYLRGSYKGDVGPATKAKADASKKDEKPKKEKKKKDHSHADDDDDGRVDTVMMRDGGPTKSDREQATDFAKILLGHRNDIRLNPHEYYIDMEGKYKFVVVADTSHPEDDWEFVAVDPATDKKIKGFKENYKDLYPKKKLCRMSFNMERMRAVDKNSNKSYPLILK